MKIKEKKKKCFLCELNKFVKEWAPLITKVEHDLPKEEQLCKKHLKEILGRIHK